MKSTMVSGADTETQEFELVKLPPQLLAPPGEEELLAALLLPQAQRRTRLNIKPAPIFMFFPTFTMCACEDCKHL